VPPAVPTGPATASLCTLPASMEAVGHLIVRHNPKAWKAVVTACLRHAFPTERNRWTDLSGQLATTVPWSLLGVTLAAAAGRVFIRPVTKHDCGAEGASLEPPAPFETYALYIALVRAGVDPYDVGLSGFPRPEDILCTNWRVGGFKANLNFRLGGVPLVVANNTPTRPTMPTAKEVETATGLRKDALPKTPLDLTFNMRLLPLEFDPARLSLVCDPRSLASLKFMKHVLGMKYFTDWDRGLAGFLASVKEPFTFPDMTPPELAKWINSVLDVPMTEEDDAVDGDGEGGGGGGGGGAGSGAPELTEADTVDPTAATGEEADEDQAPPKQRRRLNQDGAAAPVAVPVAVEAGAPPMSEEDMFVGKEFLPSREVFLERLANPSLPLFLSERQRKAMAAGGKHRPLEILSDRLRRLGRVDDVPGKEELLLHLATTPQHATDEEVVNIARNVWAFIYLVWMQTTDKGTGCPMFLTPSTDKRSKKIESLKTLAEELKTELKGTGLEEYVLGPDVPVLNVRSSCWCKVSKERQDEFMKNPRYECERAIFGWDGREACLKLGSQRPALLPGLRHLEDYFETVIMPTVDGQLEARRSALSTGKAPPPLQRPMLVKFFKANGGNKPATNITAFLPQLKAGTQLYVNVLPQAYRTAITSGWNVGHDRVATVTNVPGEGFVDPLTSINSVDETAVLDENLFGDDDNLFSLPRAVPSAVHGGDADHAMVPFGGAKHGGFTGAGAGAGAGSGTAFGFHATSDLEHHDDEFAPPS
jgi:hypothetical protein